MRFYFDHASGVPCSEETAAYFQEMLLKYGANQESASFGGRKSAKAMEEAETFFRGKTVLWTNSGTEAVISASECAAEMRPGGDLVSSQLEHPALLHALERIALREHRKLHLCRADKNGLNLNYLRELLSERTAFLALHHVQSETGGIVNPAEVQNLLKEKSPEALFLCDTIQSFGKISLPEKVSPDFMIFSGQKFGAPGGGGVLVNSSHGKRLKKIRSARHAVGRILPATALTMVHLLKNFHQQEQYEHARCLKKTFFENLTFPVRPTLSEELASPYIAHFLTTPLQGAILTRALYSYGMSISAGSACESETPEGSPALTAMGYSGKESFCALRVSFWHSNTEEETRKLAQALSECAAEY